MTLVSVPEVRALIDTPLADADLTDVIQREESWLARRIGQLSGSVTQAFWVSPSDADGSLTTFRPMDPNTLAVNDGGIALPNSSIRILKQGTLIERILGYWIATTDRQLGPVLVTYTPNDVDEVKRVVIQFCRLTLTETGFDSEQIGQYQYKRIAAPEAEVRQAAVRSLMVRHGPRTMQLRSSVHPDRVGSRTWSSWWP